MKRIVFLLVVLLNILSCSSDDNTLESDDDYSSYFIEDFIDSEINFMPEEIYQSTEAPQSPMLKLKLITTEEFPCINYEIITSQFTNGNELIIRLEDISIVVPCYTAIGPAISYIDLPATTEKVTFINGNEVDKYTITINPDKVSISLIEQSFTHSLYDETFRIPENSFAFVCGTNHDNTNIYTDFASILEQNPYFIEFSFEGDGRIPYPETTQGNWVNHPSKYYLYSDEEAFNNLARVLNNFAAENIEENSGVTIAIYGWNNMKYYSWITN